MSDTAESRVWGLQGHAPDQPVHFIAEAQQVISEVTPVLTGDSGDQRFLSHAVDCSAQGNKGLKDNR